MSSDFKDYNPNNGKLSFGVSVALHIIVFGGAILFAYLGDFFKSKPKIEATPFTLMPTPDLPDEPVEPVAEQLPDIKLKEIKDLKPIDLPDPIPEPEPEPDPKPQQEPQPKETKPENPTVSASDRAKPVKLMTKAEFDRLNPKKKKSRSKPVRPRPSVDFRSVKLDSSKVKFDVKPTPRSGSNISSSAFNLYAAHIQKKVKLAWVIPATCANLGLSVELELVISPRGKVLKARIIRSSGNSEFDASVNRVFKSISFNPPPEGVDFSAQMTFIEEDL